MLVTANLAGHTVRSLASTYQLHRGAVSEILSRHGVTGRTHGPRPKKECGQRSRITDVGSVPPTGVAVIGHTEEVLRRVLEYEQQVRPNILVG
jgi:hypothetical protein